MDMMGGSGRYYVAIKPAIINLSSSINVAILVSASLVLNESTAAGAIVE
jgi:hypothetical protein